MPAFTHPANAWAPPGPPVAGVPMRISAVDTVVIHYTAADDLIDGDPGEHASQLPAYLRAVQRAYVTSRGYSLGYNVAVDWLGGSWEIRGFTFRCAANKDHNDHTFAILVLVDGNDMATPEAAAAIRKIVAEVERRAGRQTKIVGHGQLQNPNHPTACPGSGLRAQIALGEFSPNTNPLTEEDDMGVIITNSETFFDGPAGRAKFLLMENGKLRHLGPDEWAARGSKPGIPWSNAQISRAGVVT